MKKHAKIFWIGNLVLAVLAAALLGICLHLSGTLESQKAAERWAGEGETRFAQFSCYLKEGEGLSLEDIYTFRMTLEEKLLQASIEVAPAADTEGKEGEKTPAVSNASTYVDAWSTSGEQTVRGDHGSSKAHVTAVGGEYFFFHPLRLLSGSYISEDDLMEDRVVLDEDLAWRLFGGTELEGMTVTINGLPYFVAGVVEREQDFATDKAYDLEAGMYMSYAAYSRLTEASIDCYEIVLPQPVDGFAEGLLKDNFKIGGGEIINNTGRFSLGSLWGILRDFGTRSMHRTSVIYPYWENAARYLED